MQSSRDLARPTAADRARIQAALRARLSVVVLPPEAQSVAQAARLPWLPVSGVVVGAVLLTVALLFRFRHGSRVTGAATMSVSVSAAVAAPGSAASPLPLPPVTPSAPISAATAVVSPERRPSPASFVQDPLGQEVALLGRAIRDWHTGRLGEALNSLDEHERRFPNGVLTEERRAARAQVLCLMGRRSEAQAELAHLTPQSLDAARAEQVCDAHSTTRD
ncbi:MAG: hypothetical protein ABI548_15680 [Polyangiaceae bacterium]